MSETEIKVMNNDEIRDFCIKKDLKIFELDQEIERLNNIIKEAIEYIENGSDFKSIYFKETDTEFWKIIMEDNLKNDLLEILDKGDNND